MVVSRPGWLKARWLLPALIVVLTFAVFLPTLQNGFVSWDDEKNFIENPHYRGLGWTQLRWMFTTFHGGHYTPLTWVTLGADYLLWGMNPLGYHLTSLVLHIATTLAFYFVTMRLLRLALPRPAEAVTRLASGFAALVFALHPLRVESVAWASARWDVLAGLFFLLTILAYLRACEAASHSRIRRWWLAAATGTFAVALLSKAIVMMLPVVLVALDACPLRRLSPAVRGVWVEKIPFLLLSLVGALATLEARARVATLAPLELPGATAPLAQAAFGLTFYLWKTVVPVGLSPLYLPPQAPDPLAPAFVLSGAVVLGITGGVLALRRHFPAGLVAWVCYAALLSPVLGSTRLVADRYSYLSCLGWAVLAGAGLLTAWRARENGRIGRYLVTLTIALAVLAVAVLGSLTWRQVGVWHDSVTLWTHVLRVTPDSHFAHYNLGVVLVRQGKLAEAIDHYRHSLRIKPAQAKVHVGLGTALVMEGKYAEAVDHYQQALRLGPARAETYNNLGVALAEQGKLAEAITAYQQALRLEPTYINAYNNLGNVLAEQGKLAEAITAYQQALRLEPDYAYAHLNLGRAYLKLDQREAALKQYEMLRKIDREMAERLLSLINP